MAAQPYIWVIEDCEALTARIRNECPELSVTAVMRGKLACAPTIPSLAVVDGSEQAAASCSIREMRNRHPQVPLLIVSPSSDSQCLSDEIDDFVIVPFQRGELRTRLLRLCNANPPVDRAPGENANFAEIRARYRMEAVIGESTALREAIRKVPRLGASEANVLLTGETGTGKELFARAIHYASGRSTRPFVPVNCGALPDTLFENELFGHERGAYTHATSAAAGLLEVAQGGTLFLDEVDSLSIGSQAKLLRLLQEREYRPLGSQRSRHADVRVLAAANTPLPERVEKSEFRADLFYRLNVLGIRLPTLAERHGDIPILARHFLARFARQCGRPTPKLSPDVFHRLTDYTWPGNVRELESAIQRAVVLSDGPVLHASDFDLTGPKALAPESPDVLVPIKAAISEFERGYLEDQLMRHDGNITHAARAAGKDRRTFQRLLRRHGIAGHNSAAS